MGREGKDVTKIGEEYGVKAVETVSALTDRIKQIADSPRANSPEQEEQLGRATVYFSTAAQTIKNTVESEPGENDDGAG